ncbi:MAG: archaeal heat shock protein Hsp20 [Candidatus Anstonellales archaeon]
MSNRKRRWFDDDFFFPFEHIREEMERMIEEMMREDEEFFREARKTTGPKVYGVSIRIGPDGKPTIQEFGDIRPKEKKVSEEREPLVDVMREGDEIVVVAEVPGVEKEDIKISGEGRFLEIKVDTPQRKYYKELELPAKVDHKKTKMNYKNGILELRLPIVE